MKWETVKEYFRFTKKERTGIISLLVLIFLFFIFPAVFGKYFVSDEPPKIESLDEALAKLQAKYPADSANRSVEKENHPEKYSIAKPESSADLPTKPVHLVEFDPNTISEPEWLSFGIKPKTVKTLMHYRERGGKFRVAEDLQKVYGFSQEDFQRLLPYIRIAQAQQKQPEHLPPAEKKRGLDSVLQINPKPGYQRKTLHTVNVNSADTAEWATLPGIGQKLALRIVNFREKLGGFYAAEQVGETFGLPDSTFQKLRSWLVIEKNPVLRKININKADVETLKSHPYIRWQLANSMINYRKEHGNFVNIDDLEKLALAPEGWVKKIGPYLEVGKSD